MMKVSLSMVFSFLVSEGNTTFFEIGFRGHLFETRKRLRYNTGGCLQTFSVFPEISLCYFIFPSCKNVVFFLRSLTASTPVYSSKFASLHSILGVSGSYDPDFANSNLSEC